jgi:hypothetical protein
LALTVENDMNEMWTLPALEFSHRRLLLNNLSEIIRFILWYNCFKERFYIRVVFNTTINLTFPATSILPEYPFFGGFPAGIIFTEVSLTFFTFLIGALPDCPAGNKSQ